jgi:hypothetical protein
MKPKGDEMAKYCFHDHVKGEKQLSPCKFLGRKSKKTDQTVKMKVK